MKIFMFIPSIIWISTLLFLIILNYFDKTSYYYIDLEDFTHTNLHLVLIKENFADWNDKCFIESMIEVENRIIILFSKNYKEYYVLILCKNNETYFTQNILCCA